MKKYLLLSLLIPCIVNTVKSEPGYGRGSRRHGHRHCGYNRGWRRGYDGYWGPAALTTAGLITAAAASREPKTIIIEKEATKPKTTQADLLMMQLNNLTLQMNRLNNQLEIVRKENRNLRAQLIETQRK